MLTALGNDVGFDLVFSRQLIAHARAGDIAIGLSTSGNSRNLLAAFAEARRAGLLTVGIAGYDGGDDGRRSATSSTASSSRSDSVHRIQETQAALGFALWEAVQERPAGDRQVTVPDASSDGDREAAVLDRIEAFRRRRPRLTDDVVTLAHGAGGKASAALVDAVFLDAFADDDRGPLADAATLTLPTRRAAGVQHRLVRRAAAAASRVARSATSR